MELSGIYKIECKINKKIYVGATNNFTDRHSRHFGSLSKNKHWNKELQADYNSYGKDNFEFRILEILEDANEELFVEKENYWIDALDSINLGYNLMHSIKHKPRVFTEEQKEKFRGENNPFYGKKHEEKFINKMRKRGPSLSDCYKIMDLIYEGKAYRDIEKLLGFSRNIVSLIKNGKHWSAKEIGTYQEYIKKKEGK